MGRKVKYSSKEKINAVKEYLDGKDSINSIAKRLDITFQAFKQWVNSIKFIQLLNSEDGLRSIMVMRSLKLPEQEDWPS